MATPTLRILYVENHGVFSRIVIERFLAGHEVVLEPSVAGARSRFRDGDFDAVLCDFDLDDGKGDEVVRELRSRGFEGTIVAASSHAEGNMALMAAGADLTRRKAHLEGIGRLLVQLRTADELVRAFDERAAGSPSFELGADLARRWREILRAIDRDREAVSALATDLRFLARDPDPLWADFLAEVSAGG